MDLPLTSSCLAVVASLLLAGCRSNQPAPQRDTTEAPHSGPGFRFGWRSGDRFDLVYTKQTKGEQLEVRTRGTVKTAGDKLRITFEPVTPGAKDKMAMAAGKSHAFMDVWPDLVVDKKTGELSSVEGDATPAAKDAVARRWQSWIALVGYALEPGNERSYKTEVEAGEGLLLPVSVTERYTTSPELGHRVAFTRTYEGEPTKKLWQVMLADQGAPKATVDAVQQASREEKLMVQTDPQSLHHMRIEEHSTFTVTTLDKGSHRVDLHGEIETFTFTWTR